MRFHTTRYAALAVLVGALACAGNRPETDTDTETDQAAAARDTTSDTTGAEVPPGYRGMEQDTTGAAQQQPSDTFLDNQGLGTPQDTAGYSGMERVEPGQADPSAQTDTTGAQMEQMDTTGAAGGGRDTTGAWGTDTTGTDTSGMGTGDTTGYNPSQQQHQDTTSSH